MTEAELTVPSLDGGDVNDYDETAKKIPHYALPNVAAILPDFSNVEQETIMQAFRTGNCAQSQPQVLCDFNRASTSMPPIQTEH
eukprot:SAG31_NODE_6328_length_2064_cov_1.871756_1_plen_84_part_00